MTNQSRSKPVAMMIPLGDISLQPPAMRFIESIATVVRLKRGDKIEFPRERGKVVYVVRAGFLVLRAELAEGRTVAIAVFGPGSIIRSAELPPLKGLAAHATSQAQVLRAGDGAFERLAEQNPDVRRYAQHEASVQSARDKAHVVLLAGFSGEERVASFFVEMARRLGRANGAVIVMDVPFSRSDIADFLALNPDTLSRIFSRFKAQGLISTRGRRSLEVLDIDALSRMSPVHACRLDEHYDALSMGVL